MKLFAFILLVTLVVGDGFYQPFSPVLNSHLPFLPNYYHSNRPSNWGQYYFHDDYYTPSVPYFDYHQNQRVFEGHQRSAPKNYEEANLIEPKVSFSRQRFPSWNHKYFLLDDEGHSVQALRPFNPVEIFNMLQVNKPSTAAAVTRPIFARQTIRMTNTETIRVTSTKICVSSNLFANPINPTVCTTHNRARRYIDSDDHFLDNISPTPVGQQDLVIPTILINDQRSTVYAEIESTKNNEDGDGKLEFGNYNLPGLTRNDRAMFNRNPSTTTVTVITHETSFVTKAVNPVSLQVGQPGVLLCIPPGMVVCA